MKSTEYQLSPEAKQHSSDSSAPVSVMVYLIVIAVSFSLTGLATLGWLHRDTIANLFYESSLQRYRIATGEAGPATYYVFHDDFRALDTLAAEKDDILGVEMTEYSGIAAIAFTSIEANSIAVVRGLDSVKNLLQKDIPMLCH